MNFFDIFLTTVYLHFCQLQIKRKSIIPWFNTAFSIALFGAIFVFLLIGVFFQKEFKAAHIKESTFLLLYILLGSAIFFVIKQYYFNSGRNITMAEKYNRAFSENKKLQFKIIVLGGICILPFLALFIIWYNA